jgi:hypothetical protein
MNQWFSYSWDTLHSTQGIAFQQLTCKQILIVKKMVSPEQKRNSQIDLMPN